MDEGVDTLTYKIVDNHLFFGNKNRSWDPEEWDIIEMSKKKLVFGLEIESYDYRNGIYYTTILFDFKKRIN